LVSVFVLVACYSPSLPNGKQQCGTNGACPSGYACGPDNHCYKNGQVPTGGPDQSAVSDGGANCTADSCKGGPKPVCDPTSHQCVACLVDGDCPSGQICNNMSCVPGCTAQKGCPDGGGSCDTNTKMCVRCATDGDCKSQTDPRCDTSSGICVPCLPDNDNCPKGFFCNLTNGAYSCKQGCNVDQDCVADADAGMQRLACCNHVCTDTYVDGKNCGKCGSDCNNDTCCVGICSNLTTDLGNCGACGNACFGQNASWTCAASKCAITSCNMGFGDCNKMPGDGCEANFGTDPKNCMGCGNVCNVQNATAACANGVCAVGMCNMGFGDCNNKANDGCETNTGGDAQNCGACGKPCNLANATPACVAGSCAIAMCNNGFSNCDNNVANGCEASTVSDPKNCGGCNMMCGNVANGVAGCANSMCNIQSCTMPFKDCNMMVGDGCETNTSNDINNCGNCGTKCTAGANVTGTACTNSACTITACVGGFANCNGTFGDGCEINTTNDKNNCSKCGMVCPVNTPNCVNSACQGVVVFPQASYNASVTFTDKLMATSMPLTWDGTSYWSSSGGSPAGVREAQYNAAGTLLNTYQPNIDFRSVFTKGNNTSPVYSKGYNSNIVQVQTAPGVFANSVTLVGGTLDPQSSVFWNENATELFAMSGGTVTRWTPAGVLIGTVTLAGFGNMNNENTIPQSRTALKSGGYYMTYSAGVLSAWDTNGNRVKTTVLNGAGTSSDSYWALSYANGMVWVIDAAMGTWRGYNVGL
jgi:hypothetical protein